MQRIESDGFEIRLIRICFIKITVFIRIFAAPEFAVQFQFARLHIAIFGTDKELLFTLPIGQIAIAEFYLLRGKKGYETENCKSKNMFHDFSFLKVDPLIQRIDASW